MFLVFTENINIQKLFNYRTEDKQTKEDNKLSTEKIDNEFSLPLDMLLSEEDEKKNLSDNDFFWEWYGI